MGLFVTKSLLIAIILSQIAILAHNHALTDSQLSEQSAGTSRDVDGGVPAPAASAAASGADGVQSPEPSKEPKVASGDVDVGDAGSDAKEQPAILDPNTDSAHPPDGSDEGFSEGSADDGDVKLVEGPLSPGAGINDWSEQPVNGQDSGKEQPASNGQDTGKEQPVKQEPPTDGAQLPEAPKESQVLTNDGESGDSKDHSPKAEPTTDGQIQAPEAQKELKSADSDAVVDRGSGDNVKDKSAEQEPTTGGAQSDNDDDSDEGFGDVGATDGDTGNAKEPTTNTAPTPESPNEPKVVSTDGGANEVQSPKEQKLADGDKDSPDQSKASPDQAPQKELISGKDNAKNEIQPVEGQKADYLLDGVSCSGLAKRETITQTIELILSTLASDNCHQTSSTNLKLKPAINKQITGYVMETSSLPFEANIFADAQMTYASCVAPKSKVNSSEQHDQQPSGGDQGASPTKFLLKLDQDLEDRVLTSHWRLYKRMDQEDLPSGVFKSLASAKGQHARQYRSPTGPSADNKCQRFDVQNGDYYLELLSPRTSSIYEVEIPLASSKSAGNDTNLNHVSGIRLVDFKVERLYLDHGLVKGAGFQMDAGYQLTNQYSRRQQTTQILHANNNHFRRNHWLLDMYANWMKHDYRTQLRHLVDVGHLKDQLNMCFQE